MDATGASTEVYGVSSHPNGVLMPHPTGTTAFVTDAGARYGSPSTAGGLAAFLSTQTLEYTSGVETPTMESFTPAVTSAGWPLVTTGTAVTDDLFNVTGPGNNTMVNMYAFHQREQVVFIIVLFVFIVVGNLSVLIAIGLSKRGQRSRMNFFIMHLAIADLSCGLFSVLTDMVWKITLQWYAGNVMCKIARYLQALVTYGSTYVLVSLSIDRLDAIARPMNFSGSSSRAKVLILLAWGFAALFSLPMVFINNEKVMRDGTTQCHIDLPQPWHWKLYLTLIAVALFIIPAFIIAICYITIIVVIWSKSKVMTAPSTRTSTFKRLTTRNNGPTSESQCLGAGSDDKKSSSSSRGVIPQAKIRTIKMTLVIVLVFILCWSPYFIFDLLQTYGNIPRNQKMMAFSVFVQSLAPLNSAANPLIYGIFSSRICRNLRRIPVCNWVMSRICVCCPALRVQERRHSLYSSTNMTYTNVADDATSHNLRVDGSGGAGLSGSIYVRDSLTAKETDILMRTLQSGKCG